MVLGMNSERVASQHTFCGEIFETLPESIQDYIRYLESLVKQLETRVHELEA